MFAVCGKENKMDAPSIILDLRPCPPFITCYPNILNSKLCPKCDDGFVITHNCDFEGDDDECVDCDCSQEVECENCNGFGLLPLVCSPW